MSDPATRPGRITLGIVSIVSFNFAACLCNGLPLAVLPGYVLNDLNMSPVFAGIVIGVQYLATLLSRPLSGQLADRFGSKRVVLCGLAGLVLSGALTSLAIGLHAQLWLGTGVSRPDLDTELHLGHRHVRHQQHSSRDVVERDCRLRWNRIGSPTGRFGP